MKQTLVAIIYPVTPARIGPKAPLESNKHRLSVGGAYHDVPFFGKLSNRRVDVDLRVYHESFVTMHRTGYR